MTIEQRWTIEAIKKANREGGFYWFSPDTMRFFDSIILDDVYQGPGGIYFVSSERQRSWGEGPSGSRTYSVRKFDAGTGDVKTVEGFSQLSSKAGAKAAARKLSL